MLYMDSSQQKSSRCSDLVIEDELLPVDLQYLSLAFHVECFQSFHIGGRHGPCFGGV